MGRKDHHMTCAEIQELMDLKGWSKMDLAAALKITENAVYKWFTQGHGPKGPASILMEQWLAEARKVKKPKQLQGAK